MFYDVNVSHNLKQGLILTDLDEETIIANDYTIEVTPVWKWLLR